MQRLQLTHAHLARRARSLSAAATASAPEDEAAAAAWAKALVAAGVKVVCWDMDQTMVAAHSHGRMTKAGVGDFTAACSPDFLRLCPALAAAGVQQAVTTHSDRAEHGWNHPSDSVAPFRDPRCVATTV